MRCDHFTPDTISLYERGPAVKGSGEAVMGPEVVGGMEQRSSLYGLLWWKD